jgi:adenylate kinase family enzyme
MYKRSITGMRVLITGASGSGTTTLGQVLAKHLGWAFFDADDYYWEPSDPPFKKKRAPAMRVSMLIADLDAALNGAVVSGSIMNWGLELEDSFSLIVFLTVPAPIRAERLRARELERFGRIDPEFLDWAAQYDEGYMAGRSLSKHERWLLERQQGKVLRIDGDLAVEERKRQVLQDLRDHGDLPAPPIVTGDHFA